jgi:hypothetical protein
MPSFLTAQALVFASLLLVIAFIWIPKKPSLKPVFVCKWFVLVTFCHCDKYLKQFKREKDLFWLMVSVNSPLTLLL